MNPIHTECSIDYAARENSPHEVCDREPRWSHHLDHFVPPQPSCSCNSVPCFFFCLMEVDHPCTHHSAVQCLLAVPCRGSCPTVVQTECTGCPGGRHPAFETDTLARCESCDRTIKRGYEAESSEQVISDLSMCRVGTLDLIDGYWDCNCSCSNISTNLLMSESCRCYTHALNGGFFPTADSVLFGLRHERLYSMVQSSSNFQRHDPIR
jgi:hypothetical protein